MRMLLTIALVLAWNVTLAGDLRVLLINGTRTDIIVETKKDAPVIELLPGEAKIVSPRHLQWLRLGQESYKYNVVSLEQWIARHPGTLVLQAHTDGKLYVLPIGTDAVQTTLPAQPRGFPVKPSKKVDLT